MSPSLSQKEIPIYTGNVDLEGNPLDPSEFRKDQTDSLGKPLSMLEQHIYDAIFLSEINPISNEEIYENVYVQIYGQTPYEKENESIIDRKIGIIRRKLGEKSIISYPGRKYVTRRALIEKGGYSKMKYFEINGKMVLFDNLPELDRVDARFYYKIEGKGKTSYRIDNFMFTSRQLEILTFASQGLTPRKIGWEINISYDVAYQHQKNLRKANRIADSDEVPSLNSLIEKAKDLDLLNLKTINQLKSLESKELLPENHFE